MPKNVMCKKCNNYRNQWCEMVIDSPDPDIVRDCRHFWLKTNADRIRAMTDEELMQLLFTKISCGNICSFCVPTMRTERKCDGHCKNGVLEWLQQPAEGDA